VPVAGCFVLEGADRVGFAVGAYDASLPLVIDPVLDYSTYLGGSDYQFGNAIAVDAAGNAYVTGYTGSTDFPVTPGAYQTSDAGEAAFVAKLSAAGAGLVYCTYLGGSDDDRGNALAVDAAGNAYVTGYTGSTDFPVTSGAYQTSIGAHGEDAFVAKLSADGAVLVYSTYLGGSLSDEGYGIAVDAVGASYVTGYTQSTDFPATPDAYQTSKAGYDDGFVAKLSADGANLVYSTYLGGDNYNTDSHDIAVDGAGNAYVTGITESANFPVTPGAYQTSFGGGYRDAFVAKLSVDGASLVYSTYLGGSLSDEGYGIAVDAAGNAYITGVTFSDDFPITPGAYKTSLGGWVRDAIVAKLSADGASLVYSTYLGGGGSQGNSIAVDGAGYAYVTGEAGSSGFPTTPDAYQTIYGGGHDAFVAKLSVDGASAVYATYLGGVISDVGSGIAVDGDGNAYVTGYTESRDFPVTPGAFQTSSAGGMFVSYDVFVAKFVLNNVAPSPPIDSDASLNSVAEGAANGAPVGLTASSTDADGDLVSYSLSDSAGGRFAIDASSGEVTVANGGLIDYESASGHSYNITVQASDGVTTSSKIFTIAVTNLAPTTPADGDATGNSVVEGATNGTAVGITASSSDPAGGDVTYSLSDNAGGRFAINASSGVVTAANGGLIDYESASGHSYDITVQASDGVTTSSKTFTIAVTNLAPTAPTDGDETGNSVVDGATNGTAVGITASSSDPAGGAVTYSLSDNAGGRFAIDASTGVVTVANGILIDYETASDHSYNITVQASDGELTSTRSFTIVVTPADASISGEGASIVGHELVRLADVLVATFHLSGGSPPPGDFTATIDWGDGQVSNGTVSATGGAYRVTGSHTYAGSGTFAVNTTIVDGDLSASANGSAVISARTPHERYVAAVYLDVLGRSVDPEGLAYWAGRLDAGLAISSVAESIVHSDEYYANFVIKPAFLKLLERAADADGVSYWTTQMRGGLTDQQLEAKLVSSDEFYRNAGGTDVAWIDAVYSLLLGRAADAAGETYWSGQLAAGQSRSQVAERIAGSQENNTQLINDDYFHYLGRAADPDGLAYWLEQFAAGKTNEDVIAGFTGSDEYYREHTA
ncbi:MAG TPA: SBBP repeat-containing protein, partial [Pirellulales bacterium]|nr:SBBP repeat-containing protein [Pirellulales bacterium]